MKKLVISFIILSLSFPILSANAARKRKKSSSCPDTVRSGTSIAARCAGVTVVCPSAAAAGTSISARCTSSGLTAICPRYSNNPSRACAYITQPMPSKDTSASVPSGSTPLSTPRRMESVTVSPPQCFINEAELIKKCTTCTTTCTSNTRKIVSKRSGGDGHEPDDPANALPEGHPSYSADQVRGFFSSKDKDSDTSNRGGSTGDGNGSSKSSSSSKDGKKDSTFAEGLRDLGTAISRDAKDIADRVSGAFSTNNNKDSDTSNRGGSTGDGSGSGRGGFGGVGAKGGSGRSSTGNSGRGGFGGVGAKGGSGRSSTGNSGRGGSGGRGGAGHGGGSGGRGGSGHGGDSSGTGNSGRGGSGGRGSSNPH